MTTPTTVTATVATTTKLRHEFKHQINRSDEISLSCRLHTLFSSDTHADSHGNYRVSSLYFDTADDRALREKLSGLKYREKFRLRYYGDDLSYIKLEKKTKHGQRSNKRSARLDIREVNMLLQGDIAFLLEREEALLHELYARMRAGLKPRSITRYDRKAFYYLPGNVRITLDSNLHVGQDPSRFLDPRSYLIPTGDPTLLEVKYDAYLPDIVRMAVALPDRRASAYSKYATSRRYD